MNEQLNLTQEWDKVFPKSDKVDHRKVSFRNRYGITLAEWLKLTKLSGTPSYLLGGCFALVGAGLALGAADLDVFGSVYLALQLAVACIWLAVTAVCYNCLLYTSPSPRDS